MNRPHLLLVPSFTELEWGIRPQLEEWAEVASFDMPGVGSQPMPPGVSLDVPEVGREQLTSWREAGARHGLTEADGRGWTSFVIATDSHGAPTAVGMAAMAAESVLGLALGHASLSHAITGQRAPMRGEVWQAFGQLARQGSDQFVRYGLAQMTQGGIGEDLAQLMVERFHDMDLVASMVEALGREQEPIGDELRALEVPLLLAKHEGCLASTDEGFEDIVAAFPDAETVVCPETCSSSPAFADAIRGFCERLI